MMRKYFLLLSLFLSAPLLASSPNLDFSNMPVAKPPQIAANAYILQDFNSGQTLAEHNADTPVEPASLTKMMTIYVLDVELARGTLSPDATALVSEHAWRTEGSRMFLDLNTEVPLKDLQLGVIIQSGNDASVAIAERVAGSEAAFAEMMNYQAKQLGMTNTHFTNATGLPDPQLYTTARDMATLARAMIKNFPESYQIYQQKEFFYNSIKQNNRNLLLYRDPTVDGIKTGHTSSAGYCLVASAQRDGMRLISVVLGTESDSARAEQSQTLLNYGFRTFKTQQLAQKNQVINEATIWKGQKNILPVGFADDTYVTIPQGKTNIETSVSLKSPLIAPIQAGAIVGMMQVKLNNEVISELPVIALETVEQGSLWRRFIDSIKLFFKNL
ncbi:MAG: D-alanyl-D-alanine carboxypeptidase family protein [Legionellales bacterium]|jgi:D-alanyl-D-alanine carboxypeptidase (penicillin-binding protein 5/6)